MMIKKIVKISTALLLLPLLLATINYWLLLGSYPNQPSENHSNCSPIEFKNFRDTSNWLPSWSEDKETQQKIWTLRNNVANYFFKYGAMISNSYDGPDDLQQTQISTEFKYLPKYLGQHKNKFIKRYNNDFHKDIVADLYFLDDDNNHLDVVLVFQGTQGLFNNDLLSNLSWFLGFVSKTQYDYAREIYLDAKQLAKKEIDQSGKIARYITAGHSLGGGLAQHLAFGFPCTSAIVIDSSIVVNKFYFTHTYEDNSIVHLAERGEIFSDLRELQYKEGFLATLPRMLAKLFNNFLPGKNTNIYYLNGPESGDAPSNYLSQLFWQHSVDNYVGSMAGLVLEQQIKGTLVTNTEVFKLRCLSRNTKPRKCSTAQYCSQYYKKFDDIIQESTNEKCH